MYARFSVTLRSTSGLYFTTDPSPMGLFTYLSTCGR